MNVSRTTIPANPTPTRRSVMLADYVSMIKPGIVLGNMVTLAGGFFLAARGSSNFRLLLDTMLGLALVVASGCVFNNIIDRDIDTRMQRTHDRVLVRGVVRPATAAIYATVLGIFGFGMLALTTNMLVLVAAIAGFVIYVGIYSLYMKRHSVWGTLVGSLSGAVPPVVGYCAARGSFDGGAAIALLIFALWQIPHFYAIAIHRLKDYVAAGVSVWPAVKGIKSTKRQIVISIVGFTIAAASLSMTGYTGRVFLLVALALGSYWLYLAQSGFTTDDDIIWSRKLFVFSIIVVLVISVTMGLDYQ